MRRALEREEASAASARDHPSRHLRSRDGPLVVVTGATGRIGSSTAPLLPAAWRLRLTDLRTGTAAGPAGPLPVEALDVTDGAACREAFAGADAVVHLAGVPDPAATWEQLLPANVIGTHAVAAAAMACGVREHRPPVDDHPRNRAAWLSVRDAAELLRASVEAPLRDVDGEPVGHGAGFAIGCGTSPSTLRKDDLSSTQRVLGYRPVDDAWASGG